MIAISVTTKGEFLQVVPSSYWRKMKKERNISKEEKSIEGCGEGEVNKGIIKRKWKEGKTPSPPPLEMARVIKAVHGNRKLNYVQKESPLTKHADNP